MHTQNNKNECTNFAYLRVCESKREGEKKEKAMYVIESVKVYCVLYVLNFICV